ncbi:hypothetical protein [Cumulibacter manganitolerans]|uniref:hypothetical protein n=1 Tax=Cumulibacter manganitolerans TaxID=1884992 RepID=UPI001294DD20|nr:hypothetical protein [Cumulibacter manganitolerans]
MRFRRRPAEEPEEQDVLEETVEEQEPADEDLPEDAADQDAVEADADQAAPEETEEEYEDPEPTGRFGWLKPRKRKIDYGPDFSVRVATLPDLERFPEDGHVPPEIVRSWMALQQFGEAMLLVSWLDRAPAGYVLVSWTGDWDDEVRAAYPDVPALCNLWTDERCAEDDVERRLVEAAITVCRKQGRAALLATVADTDATLRGHLEDLGFEETGMATAEKYVYRDSTGRKRRGSHQNTVLRKEL